MTQLATPGLHAVIPANVLRQLEGEITDEFLMLLLEGMKLAFLFSSDYRANLRDFRATYVFGTADGSVGVSAVFADGHLHLREEAAPEWDVKVTFVNPQALWSFLLSRDQDILNSILRDEVEVEGNINYVYKLGFMARELLQRLGIA